MKILFSRWALSAVVLAAASAQVFAVTPAEQLAAYTVLAGSPPQPVRGQQIFTTKHGKEWSCSSCHTAIPTVNGKHASTGKAIDPMAPAANPAAFTSTAKVDKWFRRNCNDVIRRECSAPEKADVLAYLLSLKP